jgi:hypothetical protein
MTGIAGIGSFSSSSSTVTTTRNRAARQDNSTTTAQTDDDTATISRKALALASTGNGQPGLKVGSGMINTSQIKGHFSIKAIDELKTDSGHILAFERYAASDTLTDGDDNPLSAKGYVVRIDPGQANEQAYVLTQDAVLTESDDGMMTLTALTPESQTGHNDLIIGVTGRSLTGSEGDDTIVALNTLPSMDITSGDGNATILLFGKRVRLGLIDPGNGDDTVRAPGELDGTSVRTGDGADTVQAQTLKGATWILATGKTSCA